MIYLGQTNKYNYKMGMKHIICQRRTNLTFRTLIHPLFIWNQSLKMRFKTNFVRRLILRHLPKCKNTSITCTQKVFTQESDRSFTFSSQHFSLVKLNTVSNFCRKLRGSIEVYTVIYWQDILLQTFSIIDQTIYDWDF